MQYVTHSGRLKAAVSLQLLFGLFLLLLKIKKLSGQQLLVASNLQQSDNTDTKTLVYKKHIFNYNSHCVRL